MANAEFNIFDLSKVTKVAVNSNMKAVMQGLIAGGNQHGLNPPQRLVPYLAQISHESHGFRYDREIWGPTAAQKRYEGRKDLGNTQPGDGSKFRGYTAMQITGRHNTTEFYKWCLKQGLATPVPDFVSSPELMNTDPWEGLGPIWYWSTRRLNGFADQGSFERITRIINGGLNGYADRCNRYTYISLIMLDYAPVEIAGFQRNNDLAVDGVAGKQTRRALHNALAKLPPVSFVDRNPSTKHIRHEPLAVKNTPAPWNFGKWLKSLFS